MINREKIFENYFNDDTITSTRLANFAGDCMNRLTAQNGGGAYTNLINLLDSPYSNLQSELDQVDTSLGIQKGKTLNLNQFITSFKETMSVQEGVIANAVGGFDSASYLEFYPKGVSEYSAATKAKLGLLVSRVNIAAEAYATQLGADLTDLLRGFDADWEKNRSQQEQQKGSVEENRNGRSEARTELGIALLIVVHTIASMFPGDVDQCLSFFSFNLLSPTAARQPKEIVNGLVNSGKTTVALNRNFAADAKTRITNTADNASLFVYLAPVAETLVGAKGREIKPGRSRNFTTADLGDVNDTFLLVHNLSAVNDAGYVVEVKG